jgi:Carboxypeptidase regulatory-like domain
MRMQLGVLCILCLCGIGAVRAQQTNTPAKHRFVVLPPDQGRLLLLPQPACPLELIDPKLLVYVDEHPGLWAESFELRNRGTKPIRAYSVAVLALKEWAWEATDSGNYIMPGKTAPPLVKGGEDEIIPLTDELREKLELRGPMKGIVALIVKRVEYADGSVFQESAYDAFEEYFEKLYARPVKEKSSSGMISDKVVNLQGQTVAKADVFAVSTRGSRGTRPHAVTDSKGNFTISGLNAGTYFLGAEKESEGYASNRDSFTSAGLAEVSQIVLLENQVVNGVILRFGPKAARLTGRIIDANTKKPVEDADIILRRADNPKHFYSTGPNDPRVWNRFAVLVPPKPFTIEVKAAGYEDWVYSKDGTSRKADALQLISGTQMDLTIALRRSKP